MNIPRLLSLVAVFAWAMTAGAGPLDQRPVQKFHVTGTVIQMLPEGLLVSCEAAGSAGNKNATGIVFVQNVPPSATVSKGSKINVMAVPSGTYQYTGVLGSPETVRKFDARK